MKPGKHIQRGLSACCLEIQTALSAELRRNSYHSSKGWGTKLLAAILNQRGPSTCYIVLDLQCLALQRIAAQSRPLPET